MKKRKMYSIYCIILGIFILGSYGGRVALWEQDRSGTPLQIYPVSVTMLPEADRAALEQGIYADSQETLTQLLEDYLS